MQINNSKGKCIKYNVNIFPIGLPDNIVRSLSQKNHKNLSPLSFSQVFTVHHTESPSFQSTLPKLSLHYPPLSTVSQVVLQLQMFSESMTSKIYASFNLQHLFIFQYNFTFKNTRLFTITELSNINLLPKNNSHRFLEI